MKNSKHLQKKNLIFQSKTVKVTYPWPSDTLVTLEDKQDKSTCQQLLALYNHE